MNKSLAKSIKSGVKSRNVRHIHEKTSAGENAISTIALYNIAKMIQVIYTIQALETLNGYLLHTI